MVKREIRADAPDALRQKYPIEGKLPNWYFRVRETSNGAWMVEGCDLWGRKVSRSGGDPDALMTACVEDAKAIRSRTS